MSARRRVVVIGAGMGGLAAALSLARAGFEVQVLEARPDPGGLAAGFEREGLPFDAGPYILLDRPGLEWAFGCLGLDLGAEVPLRRAEQVYEVASAGAPPVRFHASRDQTAEGLDSAWPGSAGRYLRFVAQLEGVYERLAPMLRRSRPGLVDLLRTGAWREAPFLLRGLGSVLARSGLPRPIQDAMGIWTHVAGQRLEEAPSPLAFVPALIHRVGAFYPEHGIGSVPRTLAAAAASAGARFAYGARVRGIDVRDGRVRAVTSETGERIEADAVVSNAGGVSTYLRLLPGIPARLRRKLLRLPLQSPGACAYLAVKAAPRPPYLRFFLPGGGRMCQLLVTPAVLCPEHERGGWSPARLIAPMSHEEAERGGTAGQRAFLDGLLAQTWWRAHLDEHRVLETRIPAQWGSEYGLYRDSMNPVMTARFMREGRLAHRSPYVRGLYLAGSATHPGQWVSFCAISGILAAQCVQDDLR